MLHKEFVPYAESLELKELGFDEPCFGYYVGLGDNKEEPYKLVQIQSGKEQFEAADNASHAPTFSQAFRWFRDKHDLIAGIFPNNHSLSNKPSYISYVGKFKKGTIEVYSNYEEAELACLRKLIEIVKNK